MRAKNRSGTMRSNGLSESAPYDLRLAFPRNGDNKPGHAEQRGDGYCNRACRHILDASKPAFGGLLLPAGCIQRHYLHVRGIVEVRFGGLVEGQVSILSNSQQAQPRGGRTEPLSVFPAYSIMIGSTSINREELAHADA